MLRTSFSLERYLLFHPVIVTSYYFLFSLTWVKVRHEGAWKMRDRPLGAGLQELASNRLKLHW
jgi:hypothetical protein